MAGYLEEQQAAQEAAVMASSILPFARLGAGVTLKPGAAPPPLVGAGGGIGSGSGSESGSGRGADEEEEAQRCEGALLGDAPPGFAGRQEGLCLVLLRRGDLCLVEARYR